jgi:hypothetical protein
MTRPISGVGVCNPPYVHEHTTVYAHHPQDQSSSAPAPIAACALSVVIHAAAHVPDIDVAVFLFL